MKRKPIPKETRLQVYNKYDKHCAYCGCELAYKDMQVDHFASVYLCGDIIDIRNLMPACRACNFYKSTYTLEGFRKQLSLIPSRLDNQLTYRLAKKYNLIQETNINIKFYFECVEENKD